MRVVVLSGAHHDPGGAGHHGVLCLQLAKLPGQGFNPYGHLLLLVQVVLQELGGIGLAEILGHLHEGGVHRHLVVLGLEAGSVDDVAVLHGDTSIAHYGRDTYGSRATVLGGTAIIMCIDRIEHFMGGDAYPSTRSAYASLEAILRTAWNWHSRAE